MKKLNHVFILFLSLPYIYAQEGKVGINTQEPTNTLDIAGDLRIRNAQETSDTKRLLAIDENGVVQKTQVRVFGAIGTTKVSAIGIGTNKPLNGIYQQYRTLRYDTVKVDNDELIYNEDTGKFIVKKPGYYLYGPRL